MKLYTINATPVRAEKLTHVNDAMCEDYPTMVSAILQKYGIDGFTIYEVKGFWKGEAERSFKIEIAIEASTAANQVIQSICKELRDTWNQDAVMVTTPANTVEFI